MSGEQQRPLGSGYTAQTTAAEVVDGMDLSGRHYIVTGGYSGIGIETVRAISDAGGIVTVPARNRAKAEQALAEAGLPDTVELADMDLADLASVRRFADDYVATGRTLDGLINNAGVMACPLERIGNGWEYQFAVCHLGHFVLTNGLEAPLKAAGDRGGARVVALSSIAHARSDVLWDDPTFERTPYDKWVAYGQAKTANALFALGLDQRWQADGVRAFSVHPGGIMTPLQRHLPQEEMVALGWMNPDGSIPEAVSKMFKSVQAGSATSIWCALSPRLEGLGGLYCEDVDVAQLADENSPRWAHVRPWACDNGNAAKLWAMTEAMLAA